MDECDNSQNGHLVLTCKKMTHKVLNDLTPFMKKLSLYSKDSFFLGLSIFSLAFLVFIGFFFLSQPLIDAHAFRQTQTALTSFWMLEEGFKLNYATPVLGYPWSIPFEFPIYQALAAGISAITGASIVITGRLLSLAFLIACAWPIIHLTKRLALSPMVAYIAIAMLWSSPTYIYWGRAYLMETAALFFTLAALPYGATIILGKEKWWDYAGFLLFSILAILQKITTFLPVLMVLFLLPVLMQINRQGPMMHKLKRLSKVFILFLIPLLVGTAWSWYADSIRSLNLHGAELISSKLVLWNFGSIQQRLSWDLWYTVILKRSLITNVGAGVFGLPFLVIVPIISWKRGTRNAVLLAVLCLVLFLLPIAIFTNLHIVHSYYQTACHVWLGCAVAILLGASLTWYPYYRGIAALVASFFVFLNIILFYLAYYPHISLTIQDEGQAQQAYHVGKFLQENTQVGSGIVVYNQNYSAEIAFHSERKAMTLFDESPYAKEIFEEPQRFLGDAPLAAITVCPLKNSFPTKNDLDRFLERNPGWRLTYVKGCAVLLPKQSQPDGLIKK
jgi:hypothetical protein